MIKPTLTSGTHGGMVQQLSVEMLSADEPSGLRLSPAEIMAEQRVDEVIKPVYDIVLNGGVVDRNNRKQLGKDSNVLLKQLNKLTIDENGVLVRKTQTFNQIVLPKKYHPIVYSELREKLGHVGSEKVLELARARFYWPWMSNHIEFYVRNQCKCLIDKKPNRKTRAPLVPIVLEASFPFEWVSVDFLKLDKARGYEYALVVTDHFTRFTQIYGTKKNNAIAAAEKMYNEYIPHYGFPLKFHSDKGGEFCNKLQRRLQQLAGIEQSNTTSYHPEGNGQVERVNRTVLNMLKTLRDKEKQNWKAFLPKLAFAINTTVNKSTSFSPYFLMFGRSPILPIDLIFGIEPRTEQVKMRSSHEKFIEEWQSSMKEAFDVVRQRAEKSAESGKPTEMIISLSETL